MCCGTSDYGRPRRNPTLRVNSDGFTSHTSPRHLTMVTALLVGLTALVQPPALNRRSAVLGAAAASISCIPSVPAFAASQSPTFWELKGGVKMPLLALNTAGLSAEGSARATSAAFAAGFRHVDFHPGIERDGVAQALKTLTPAEAKSFFLTTKIRKPPIGTSPADAAALVGSQLTEDLAVLGLPRVDMLMLRDSPDPLVIQAQWAAVEAELKNGRARSVGVINYCEGSLKTVLATAKTKPALNYIMQHVGMGPDPLGLRSFGESQGIRTFAYGAYGEPGPIDALLKSPTLKSIGEANGRSVEEVALRWGIQSGCAVSVRPTTEFGLGKSVCADGDKCPAGLALRSRAFEWELSKEEMAQLDAMTSPGGNPTLFSTTACPDSFFAMPSMKKQVAKK